MSEHTIAHYMPRKLSSDTIAETVSKIKLFESDHSDAVKLHEKAQRILRALTLQEIIREAVREGLPAVIKRYTAAVEAAATEDKRKS